VVELNFFNQIHKLTKLITHITFSKFELFYSGLAPYTGYAPLGFMSTHSRDLPESHRRWHYLHTHTGDIHQECMQSTPYPNM